VAKLFEVRQSTGASFGSEMDPTFNHSLVYGKLPIELSKNVLGSNRLFHGGSFGKERLVIW
jgi:hypothetical protein